MGLAKNNLNTDDITPLLSSFGKVPLPADQVEAYQAELKKRDVIIEKNKKLKASKKPEEPVPIMDALESEVQRDAEGNEVTNYFLLKCPQFKHLNLCLNKIGDDAKDPVMKALQTTPDDFGITLAGNQLSGASAAAIHQMIKEVH